ncbi:MULTISPECIES: PAS domain-containing protein [Kordiimonas]|jgi:hypothetical protein|uniref:PAS domain-containing protein n=1 Tax=Kordiimonas TaxID=288021 RepID=UPI00257B2E4D|nr:PAS domain-containing protein [Kordiimonas sp. UBA4487]
MTTALEQLQHSKATQQLIQFWLNLPRPEGSVCPRRSDFSSAQINGSISEVFLSEWEDAEILRVVQAGTVLDRHIGIDMTGKNIFDMTPEELVEDERAYYKALRDQPCAGMITRSMINFADVPFVYRTIQLPLLDPFGNVRHFVGTGVVLKEEDIEREFGRRCFRRTRLVERHFFDIGAGLPPPEKAGQLSQGGPLHSPEPRD